MIKTTNSFFLSVIEEEDNIIKEIGEINKQIKIHEDEIHRLKTISHYYPRKYCKFCDGYNCKFTGNCTHKEDTDEFQSLFGVRCFAEKHARGRKY